MNNLIKEFIAEFIGTAILMIFGISGCATNLLSHTNSIIVAGLSYAFGAAAASFFAGPISGAHINPAISFAFCVIRKTPWYKFPIYMVAQYLGSFVASAIAYGLYFESMKAYDIDLHQNITHSVSTASIFITLPATHITIGPAIADQVVSTGLLAFAILFISDELCYRTPAAIQILSCAFAIFSFVVAFNYNAGAILNPARDLAPRVFLSMTGYSGIVWSALDGHFWWAVGIIAPHVGAILGALLYLLMSKMRMSYVDSSHRLDTVLPPMNPERDLIYQKGTEKTTASKRNGASSQRVSPN
ncbi:Aquaporin-7 [Tyrophagus putrescentiae]|nr:Aquaporin-7 [Tyrophagus putrescentiae]